MNNVQIRSSRFVRRSVRFNVGSEGVAVELGVLEGQILEQQEHQVLEGLDEEPVNFGIRLGSSGSGSGRQASNTGAGAGRGTVNSGNRAPGNTGAGSCWAGVVIVGSGGSGGSRGSEGSERWRKQRKWSK